MKCQNCGANVENAQVCPNCGTILQAGNSTSQQIPTIIINNVNKNENTNINAGYSGNGISHKSKMVALILAIFLGCLGIHRFYVGKVGSGIIWFLPGAGYKSRLEHIVRLMYNNISNLGVCFRMHT